MTVNEEIKIAEKRIVECEERRKYFVEKYQETNSSLYRKLAESETDTISEIRQAICEAIVGR